MIQLPAVRWKAGPSSSTAGLSCFEQARCRGAIMATFAPQAEFYDGGHPPFP